MSVLSSTSLSPASWINAGYRKPLCRDGAVSRTVQSVELTDGREHLIGLIADTHGLVRASVHVALAGVEVILHAGDVGGDAVLDELGLIAPVRAVVGNTDSPSHALTTEVVYTAGGVDIHVSHGHEVGAPTPDRLLERYPQRVLVYGHTHRALVAEAAERLVVNPGAAGPRRFNLAPSVGLLRIRAGGVAVEIVDLEE
jgi:putative phosphoesterase